MNKYYKIKQKKKRSVQMGRLWRGRRWKKRQTKKGRGQKGWVFVLDYFCGVASVCSSCGQWIMQKIHEDACLSLSVSLFCVSLQWRKSKFYLKRITHQWLPVTMGHPTNRAPHRDWESCRGALSTHQTGGDRSTAATVGRLGLGSDHVVTPFLLPVQL